MTPPMPPTFRTDADPRPSRAARWALLRTVHDVRQARERRRELSPPNRLRLLKRRLWAAGVDPRDRPGELAGLAAELERLAAA